MLPYGTEPLEPKTHVFDLWIVRGDARGGQSSDEPKNRVCFEVYIEKLVGPCSMLFSQLAHPHLRVRLSRICRSRQDAHWSWSRPSGSAPHTHHPISLDNPIINAGWRSRRDPRSTRR